jgi:hypothetical protein
VILNLPIYYDKEEDMANPFSIAGKKLDLRLAWLLSISGKIAHKK